MNFESRDEEERNEEEEKRQPISQWIASALRLDNS